MNVVVYESVYGNTREIAEAVADGLGEAVVVRVREADGPAAHADLLVVGSPTHIHSLPTVRSRQTAAEAANEDGHVKLDPGATDEPGLRRWLHDLPTRDGKPRGATFDTRIDKSPLLTGAASRGIAKRLRARGYEVVASESFFVEESEGPLQDGELERAKSWGRELAQQVALSR